MTTTDNPTTLPAWMTTPLLTEEENRACRDAAVELARILLAQGDALLRLRQVVDPIDARHDGIGCPTEPLEAVYTDTFLGTLYDMLYAFSSIFDRDRLERCDELSPTYLEVARRLLADPNTVVTSHAVHVEEFMAQARAEHRAYLAAQEAE